MKNSIYNRTQIILGKEKLKKINEYKILICGIGGVGSYTLEALARIGALNITVVDKDIVDITNINRQILALNSTIGKSKVEVACSRCKDINSDINIVGIKRDIRPDTIEEIIGNQKYDYIVDCVDNIEAKLCIIEYSYKHKIKCISSMGAANKLNPLDFRVADIYKTTMCPLAKVMRKELRKLGIKKQKVVYSIEKPIKSSGEVLGSVSFVPSVCGLIIASEIIKDIIKEES